MAVRREFIDYFEEAPAEIACAVREILSRKPPYYQVAETERNLKFTTRVIPRPILDPTPMTIALLAVGSGTQVTVTINSPSYIFGDIFGMYREYIRDFLEHLHAEMRRRRITVREMQPGANS